jgi:hypothetical protein
MHDTMETWLEMFLSVKNKSVIVNNHSSLSSGTRIIFSCSVPLKVLLGNAGLRQLAHNKNADVRLTFPPAFSYGFSHSVHRNRRRCRRYRHSAFMISVRYRGIPIPD